MQKQLNGKLYYCTSPRMYSFLVMNGVKPSTIVPHFKNPDHVVWIFDLTEDTKALIEYYFETQVVEEEGDDNK